MTQLVAKTVLCDKCKKVAQGVTSTWAVVEHYINASDCKPSVIDLCASCYSDFRKWLDKES